MSFPNGSAKANSTSSYTGEAPAYQLTSGTLQTGGWATPLIVQAGLFPPKTFQQEITEGVSAASFVVVSGQDSRLKQVGTRQQLALLISLSGDASGYQLTPALTDAYGGSSTPCGAYFTGISRQRFVCTFSNGKIIPVAVGQCEVEVMFPVAQVNGNWSGSGLNVTGSGGSTSNPSNFISATINVVVTR